MARLAFDLRLWKCPMAVPRASKAAASALDYGPLKGTVNGRNGVKRALVRSMTGIGSMAAYLVGGGGYGGLTGPIDQSVLLRERIASNVGLAGEQELMAMGYSQNVVVTLLRQHAVLHRPSGSGYDAQSEPILPRMSDPALGRTSLAQNQQALPTAAELRELVAPEERTQPDVSRGGGYPGTGATPPQQ